MARRLLCFAVMCTMLNAQDMEKRIGDLIARMTIEEKLGQMSQSTALQAAISPRIRDEIRRGRWGSFLNAGSAATRAEAQRIAREESRLGIPLLFGRDVIHGYRTVFPIPLGQSASWDPELIREAARAAAREAAGEGIHWTFAPMVDITRDPRWGRIAETLGEDPYLTGVLGAAMVRGFQGSSLATADSLAACAKHYAGYGAAEAGRDYNSTWIPELLLRQIYLPPFRTALDAGVATFMTSFNALNGVPASADRFTLRQVLRGEWKFDGMVVSDYESIAEMVAHGFAADAADAARKAALAGVDMEMVSASYFDHLKNFDEKVIDGAVRNILRLKFRLGLFDGRAQGRTEGRPSAESLETARRLAVESLVLLKNEGNALPLPSNIGRVAVIGPLADSPVDQLGAWAMDARADEVHTPLAALRRKLGAERVLYASALKNSRDTSPAGFAAAVEAARKADAVLLFLGEEQTLSGEARSRAFLNLPGAQEALAGEIARCGKPVIGVILAGRPLTFHETAAKLNAVIYAWHPGTMGGPAIADALFGDTVPSGRLTVTFPRTVGQVPIYYNHLNTGRPPAPGDSGMPMGSPINPEGYTSKYLDVDFTPEYPFGYGLSYAAFEYSPPRLSARTLRAGASLTVSADIVNTGKREGEEIAQLYIRDLAASVAQPVRVLKGFRRIRLKPGEKQTVRFTLSPGDLAIRNERMEMVTEPGRFHVWISPDSARGVPAGFTYE